MSYRDSLRSDLAFVERELSKHADPDDTVGIMWGQRRQALLEEITEAEGGSAAAAPQAFPPRRRDYLLITSGACGGLALGVVAHNPVSAVCLVVVSGISYGLARWLSRG